MNPIELGKFIASLRNEKNLTQEELADKLFIDKRKISRWECGTSIPEFEMLMKLSEILDVSLYELSICKRITNDKLNRKIINKFISIKDFKKYKIKKILVIILFIILTILFIKMTIYTFKNSGNVKVYKIESLDENVNIVGNIIKISNDYIINVSELSISNKPDIIINKCDIDIFDIKQRVFFIYDNKKHGNNVEENSIFFFDETHNVNLNNNQLKFVIKCKVDDKMTEVYSFNSKIEKKYDNTF